MKTPVNEVTKLLTGDLSTATGGLPVADQVLTDVGTTLDGTVDGAPGHARRHDRLAAPLTVSVSGRRSAARAAG